MTSPTHVPRLGPLPLVLGITGHRDIRPQDRPSLEAALRGIFTELHSQYPHTPLILLSALAEGADRLAAQVALDCGHRLIAPLPLPNELYKEDFETPESRAEFDALRERASEWFVMPLLPGVTLEQVSRPGDARNNQYAVAGAHIVRHCQILIALWDGERIGRVGGTSNIVQFHLEGVPEVYGPARSRLDPIETGPVYQIVTPRLSNPTPQGAPFALVKLYRHKEETEEKTAAVQAAYESVYANLEAFNTDALRVQRDPVLKAAYQQSREYLFPESKAPVLSPDLKAMRESFAIADSLAQHYNRMTYHSLRDLYLLIGFAIVAFVIFERVLENIWILATYILLTLAAYGRWFFGVKRSDCQNRFQDYRALAEGLRVQFFWHLAGLPDVAADHYLRRQRSEMDWIRDGVRVWCIADRSLEAEEARERLPLLQEHWIADQAHYFVKAAHREEAQQEVYERAFRMLLTLGVILPVSVNLLTLVVTPWHQFFEEHKLEKGWVAALTTYPGIFAALIEAYTQKKALSQHAKQYRRMSAIFAKADQHIKQMIAEGKQERVHHLLVELGREALTENGDWIVTHRERPVDLPHG
ncbi:MAG TPA: hypothetical protein VKU00_03890 [Chthonomonadaceae bacterium]|nr:hypothetical protein [Chthonomonadaceae bacterium]